MVVFAPLYPLMGPPVHLTKFHLIWQLGECPVWHGPCECIKSCRFYTIPPNRTRHPQRTDRCCFVFPWTVADRVWLILMLVHLIPHFPLKWNINIREGESVLPVTLVLYRFLQNLHISLCSQNKSFKKKSFTPNTPSPSPHHHQTPLQLPPYPVCGPDILHKGAPQTNLSNAIAIAISNSDFSKTALCITSSLVDVLFCLVLSRPKEFITYCIETNSMGA